MKKFTIIIILSIAIALSGCVTEPEQKTAATAPTPPPFDLKVVKWGPESTKVNVIPNKQPDGSMGIWIEVASTLEHFGDAEVSFGGRPAKATAVQTKLITAAISSEELTAPGEKEVVVRQIATEKTFPIGKFKVAAN